MASPPELTERAQDALERARLRPGAPEHATRIAAEAICAELARLTESIDDLRTKLGDIGDRIGPH